jgi:hypothetical protein
MAQGLDTIRINCVNRGESHLLAFINANAESNKLKYHQACRTAFNKTVKLDRAEVKVEQNSPIKKHLRSECPAF